MDTQTIIAALAGLPLGRVEYFSQIDSTNDEALRWIALDAPHYSLVMADEQIQGKGRAGRSWITRAGAALAFSLVYRFTEACLGGASVGLLAALGGVAVCQALESEYHLPVEIKWPNDVLIGRRKVAGVLAEAQWQGDQPLAAVLGIGVNVSRESLPPPAELFFPATFIEAETGQPVERLGLLRAILAQLFYWHERLCEAEFLQTWWTHLAFRDETVRITAGPEIIEGQITGLEPDGALILVDLAGQVHLIHMGEVSLRPRA